MQFIFGSLHQILNDDDETYGYVDAERKLGMGRARVAQVRRQVHRPRARAAFQRDHLRRLPRADQQRCRHRPFAGPLDAGRLPRRDLGAGHAGPATGRSTRATVERILFDNLRTDRPACSIRSRASRSPRSVSAGYVMGNLSGDRWRGNVGVRFVDTDQTSSGNQIGARWRRSKTRSATTRRSRVDRTYDDLLPSLNFAYDLTNNSWLRLRRARTMARPDFTDIAPRVKPEPGALTGQTAAIRISIRIAQPGRRVAGVVSDDRTSAVALAIYYKDIKSFITDERDDAVLHHQYGDSPPSLQCVDVGARTSSTARSRVNRRSNGGGGNVQGFEFAVTQPIAGGLRLHRQLHVLGCGSGQRRSDSGQLEGHVQLCRLLRERPAQRAAVVHVSLRLLRDLRPLDAS